MNKDLLLLGLLRNHEMHGYEINHFIEESLSTCIDIKKPTAYYVLNKMEQSGWVRFEETQEGNRPTRRVYSITPAGEAAFQRLLRKNLAGYQATQFDGDIGLAFLDSLPPKEAVSLLKQRSRQLRAHRDRLEEIPPHPGGFQYVIEHQKRHVAAELDWLEMIITQIKVLEEQV